MLLLYIAMLWWLFGVPVAHGLDERSIPTPGPVRVGRVTMSRFNSQCGAFISVCNQPPRSTQPGHPFVVSTMSISQRAVTPCGWGVKAGMVRVWVTRLFHLGRETTALRDSL